MCCFLLILPKSDYFFFRKKKREKRNSMTLFSWNKGPITFEIYFWTNYQIGERIKILPPYIMKLVFI